MKEIRFDDIDALRAEISEEYGPWSPSIEVTQNMIDGFAELTGDRQWIHVDVDRAKRESPYGGTIAHGFLTLSLMPAMRPPASKYRIIGYGTASNYGSDGFRFLDPVPAGCQLQARARLVDVDAKPKGTLLTTEHVFQVVGNERPSLIYKMLVMYRPKKS